MNIYLGFDPGGEKKFGWAVCSSKGDSLYVQATGIVDHAEEAIKETLSRVPNPATIAGAGIDAPLFWVEGGGRNVDKLVRDAISEMGAPSPGGTVQHFNSLRGACLVQGVMVANLLHSRFPNITITESHPKALLYLLGIADKQKAPKSVSMADLADYVSCDKEQISEHQRDAVLGAFTAFAQKEKLPGWRNLFKEEKKPVTPFNYSAEYWMPWDLVKNIQLTASLHSG